MYTALGTATSYNMPTNRKLNRKHIFNANMFTLSRSHIIANTPKMSCLVGGKSKNVSWQVVKKSLTNCKSGFRIPKIVKIYQNFIILFLFLFFSFLQHFFYIMCIGNVKRKKVEIIKIYKILNYFLHFVKHRMDTNIYGLII